MLDKAIVTVFCMLILISLAVFAFDLTFSAIQKISFDHICRNTLYRLDMAGGMTEEIEQDLLDALEAKGFVDIFIHAPAHVQYADKINLTVIAKSTGNISAFWVEIMGEKTFAYKHTVISRKIHNDAF